MNDLWLGPTVVDLIFERMQLRGMLPTRAGSALCYGGNAEDRRLELAGLFDEIAASLTLPEQPGVFDFVTAEMELDLPVLENMLKLLRPGGAFALHFSHLSLLRRRRSNDMKKVGTILCRNDIWEHEQVRPDLLIGKKIMRNIEIPQPPRLRLVASR